jgi:hypothetical protein
MAGVGGLVPRGATGQQLRVTHGQTGRGRFVPGARTSDQLERAQPEVDPSSTIAMLLTTSRALQALML